METAPVSTQQKSWTTLVLIGIIIIILALTGFLLYQNMQLREQVTKANQSPNPSQLISPTPVISDNQPSPISPSSALSAAYSYNKFTINYSPVWTLSEISKDQNFPLKERLSGLSDMAISLSKNGIYLIVTIEASSDGSAGGIFVGDNQFSEFVANKDKLTIAGTEYFLSRDHQAISELNQAHSGPWGWSSLSEYVPQKTTESGNVFKGYNTVISRNGFTYNVIIAGEQSGSTDIQLQQEIISMLQSIQW